MTLLLALLLDAALGEPRQVWDRIPHPAVVMGRIIARADLNLNSGRSKRLKGALLIIGLCVCAFLVGNLIAWFPDFGVFEVILVAILLAHRSLLDHVQAVADALAISPKEGRKAVAMIVGRDTTDLNESDISRAAIESAAENFSDGVVAPAFWFAVMGLPGILIYKIVNTADSMIGYRTPRHQEFGWAAARLDDLLNWIPARLSGALICATSLRREPWSTMTQDAQYHRSPNAGWPEAAMAGSLNIALSGPRTYEGQRTQDPFVNAAGRRELTASDITSATHTLWKAWGLLLCLTLLFAALRHIV